MFKKDSYSLGAVLGFVGPIIGMLIFKFTKFASFTFADTFQYMIQEQGHRTLTVALSLALLMNAVFFTLFINSKKDKTAKGIFILTCIYGIGILLLKSFS